jgi:hypothetical protein
MLCIYQCTFDPIVLITVNVANAAMKVPDVMYLPMQFDAMVLITVNVDNATMKVPNTIFVAIHICRHTYELQWIPNVMYYRCTFVAILNTTDIPDGIRCHVFFDGLLLHILITIDVPNTIFVAMHVDHAHEFR